MISYVTVGAEVGFYRPGSCGRMLMGTGFGKVTKINGHGHITVDTGASVIVFDKFGYERNNKWGVKLMEPSTLRENIKQETDRRDRTMRVKGLIQRLEGSFSYSGDAHIDEESKLELLALVKAL